MFLRILQKDLMKRKVINCILFLFITLATVFLASSVNNILSVSGGISYFLDYANVPDIDAITTSRVEVDDIDHWLKEQHTKGLIQDYAYDDFYSITEKSITVIHDGKEKKIESNGAEIFLGVNHPRFDKVYDSQGNPFALQPGEIGLTGVMMRNNDLAIGDTFIIKIGDIEKAFTVKVETKDAALGSEMSGMMRLIVHEEDYNAFKNSQKSFSLFHIQTKQMAAFTEELNKKGFTTIGTIVDRSQYQMMYVFDTVIAGLLIAIGICLIFIALLVLRFTLVFTLEEQYCEIGILKAIGMRNRNIQNLYLVKYFFIVTLGAILGMLLSIPVSSILLDSVSMNIILNKEGMGLGVNLICAIIVILIVLAFCLLCTRRLRKISAIQAIRNGECGERFHNRRFPLHKRKHLPLPLYLGIHDITSHPKRYAALIITFCVSFILITIPLNTLETMQGEEMIEKFMLDPDSAVYMRFQEQNVSTTKELYREMAHIQQDLKKHGYDAKLAAMPVFFLPYYGQNDQNKSLLTIQILGDQRNYATYAEGSAPRLENEIACSRDVLKENNWRIGDTVDVAINGIKRKMIITGTYSDYMQLGKSVRLNPVIDLQDQQMFACNSIMINMDTTLSQAALKEELDQELPQYPWATAQEMIDINVGGIKQVLQDMVVPMTAMLCGVIIMITLLMEKLLITREKGEIAMMKSVGFNNSSLRLWQMTRMFTVVMTSMIFAIPLSLVSNHFILKPIFKLMGADMSIITNPLQAYLIYPLILFIGILIATRISTSSMKNIDIREMNNVE